MAELLKLKSSQGVIVASVEKGSPAEKAGIKSYDVLLKMSGRDIESYDSFRNQVAMLAPGSEVIFLVLRDGNTLEIAVKLAERQTTMAQGKPPKTRQQLRESLGIEVQNLTKDLAQQFGYQLGEGVIVTSVEPGSPAAEAGIQAGDLIQGVNRQSVSTVDDFQKAIARASGDKVLLLVRRGEYSQFIVVRFAH